MFYTITATINNEKSTQKYGRPSKRATDDIRKYNQKIIRETIMVTKGLSKVRRTQKLGQERLITLLNKQGGEIHDQDKIIERIE